MFICQLTVRYKEFNNSLLMWVADYVIEVVRCDASGINSENDVIVCFGL